VDLVEDLEVAMDKVRLLGTGEPQLETFWQQYAVSLMALTS
jgi:hypothetical protein